MIFASRQRPEIQRIHAEFERRSFRAIEHFVRRPEVSVDRVASWTGMTRVRVECAQAAALQRPITGSHQRTVDFLFCLIEWAGHNATIEQFFRGGGRGWRVDLLAEINDQLLLVEYKTGRLGAVAAQEAEEQVLGYRNIVGAGTPMVVTERPSVPCPTVESHPLDVFCAPLFSQVADRLSSEAVAL